MSFHKCKKMMRVLTLRSGLLFMLAAATGVSAETAPEILPVPQELGLVAAAPLLPSEYGEVIYQKDGSNPRQIYIIGQSHRSGSTGRNGEDTVQVQTEIYRIGEHLIRENGIELLLPEGYFQRGSAGALAPASPGLASVGLDNQTLRSMLSIEDRFVNADMLLKNSYNIRLAQVEDEEIYHAVRGLLQQGLGEERLSPLARLEYAQEKRSALMLQNAASVVEQAYLDGAIASPRAMFTIGLAHVDEIIAFLEEGMISLKGSGEEFSAQLDLLEQGYGVTVIIPRTLAENEEALRLARIDIE